jgi:hypothetical protein
MLNAAANLCVMSAYLQALVRARSNLQPKVVDTRGVDDVVARSDIEELFEDPKATIVLCNSFNDAPDLCTKTLLDRVRETNVRDFANRVLILVLPHPGEALTCPLLPYQSFGRKSGCKVN